MRGRGARKASPPGVTGASAEGSGAARQDPPRPGGARTVPGARSPACAPPAASEVPAGARMTSRARGAGLSSERAVERKRVEAARGDSRWCWGCWGQMDGRWRQSLSREHPRENNRSRLGVDVDVACERREDRRTADGRRTGIAACISARGTDARPDVPSPLWRLGRPACLRSLCSFRRRAQSPPSTWKTAMRVIVGARPHSTGGGIMQSLHCGPRFAGRVRDNRWILRTMMGGALAGARDGAGPWRRGLHRADAAPHQLRDAAAGRPELRCGRARE